MKKTLRTTLLISASVLAAGAFVGNYFYNMALVPSGDRSAVMGADHNTIESDEKSDTRGKANMLWFEEMGHTDKYLLSKDRLWLHAYMLRNKKPSHRWVIIGHGYTGDGLQMVGAGKRFNNMGFNVLLPDARGHGKSEGAYIGMGWPDRKDFLGWINLILKMDPAAEIVLYGISMGGATVMMTSGEILPKNVKAIVEDCGYTSAKDEFTYQIKQSFGLPPFPVIPFASAVSKLRAGFTLGEASAIKQVAKSKTPMMFIHGTKDTFVPFSMLDKVYNAAHVEKEKYVVKGAGHGTSSLFAGDEYWARVQTFIEKYLDK